MPWSSQDERSTLLESKTDSRVGHPGRHWAKEALPPNPKPDWPLRSLRRDLESALDSLIWGDWCHHGVSAALPQWRGLKLLVPTGAMVKNPPANAGDLYRHEFHPWVSKILWMRAWQPTPVFLPGESHGQRSLAGYSLHG